MRVSLQAAADRRFRRCLETSQEPRHEHWAELEGGDTVLRIANRYSGISANYLATSRISVDMDIVQFACQAVSARSRAQRTPPTAFQTGDPGHEMHWEAVAFMFQNIALGLFCTGGRYTCCSIAAK